MAVMSQFESDETRIDEKYDLDACHVHHTLHHLNSASEVSHNLHKNVYVTRSHYDEELDDVWYKRNGFQYWLIPYDSRSSV